MKSTNAFIKIISAIFFILNPIASWAGSNSNQQAILDPIEIKNFAKDVEKANTQ